MVSKCNKEVFVIQSMTNMIGVCTMQLLKRGAGIDVQTISN